MGIRSDFTPYTDTNKLLAPNPVSPGTVRGSDNGPMFTSEYFIMIKKNGFLAPYDVNDYEKRMNSCLNAQGMLCRAPGDLDQEEPDDYYGVANGCMELGLTSVPRKLLWAMFRYAGCLNNNSPGTWSWNAWLVRQPQLVAAVITAAFPSKKNPLHWLVRLLAFPLYLWSAAALVVSCLSAPASDTDSRRLAWHLGNCVSKVSLLNWLAYKVWLNRLKKVYPTGMHGVAALYYQPYGNNPYEQWWVT